MSFLTVLWIAFGLAMDATAVAAARGLAVANVRARDAVRIALWFGGFQALMPAIGWAVGARVGDRFAAWDHWIAFVVLGGLGGKRLWEAWRGGAEETADAASGASGADGASADPFRALVLVPLAIATSLDALAAGFTLPMLDAPFALSLATIGVVTALLSVAGVYTGRRLGATLGKRLDALGGLALVAMGTKILVEHLRA
jgi:putative Mn2+ efflux pump MntP